MTQIEDAGMRPLLFSYCFLICKLVDDFCSSGNNYDVQNDKP